MVKLEKENLHHAYVYVGDEKDILKSLLDFIGGDLGQKTIGNPDMRIERFQTFGIDDARRLKETQLKKSVTGGKKFFILIFDSITIEAQNSLLKIFEEPTDGTHFFIITGSSNTLLPTLLSRVRLEIHKSETNTELENMSKKLLTLNGAERIILLKDIIEEKDKAKALQFINFLEKNIYNKKKSVLLDSGEIDSFDTISICRKYILDRGSSVKILMEYLALNI